MTALARTLPDGTRQHLGPDGWFDVAKPARHFRVRVHARFRDGSYARLLVGADGTVRTEVAVTRIFLACMAAGRA